MFIVQVFGIDVFLFNLVGIAPIDIIHLNLGEIPMILVGEGNHLVELALLSMERPAEVADATFLALLHEEIEHAVVDKSLLEVAGTVRIDATEGMEEIIINMFDAELHERILIHAETGLTGPCAEVGEFGGDEPFVARMAVKGHAGGPFRHASHVDGGGIKIIHSMIDGIVDHTVDEFLIELGIGVVAQRSAALDRETHHAETEQADLLAVLVGTIGHRVHRHLTGAVALGLDAVRIVAPGGNRRSCSHSAEHTFQKRSPIHGDCVIAFSLLFFSYLLSTCSLIALRFLPLAQKP